MTFEEWDNQLAEQAIELEEAAEAMNISMDESIHGRKKVKFLKKQLIG